jgi:hypothetical protein
MLDTLQGIIACTAVLQHCSAQHSLSNAMRSVPVLEDGQLRCLLRVFLHQHCAAPAP